MGTGALAEALRALADTLRFYREMGVTDLPLSREYLPGPADALRHLERKIDGCTRCKLCEGRTTIVFGAGNPNADLVCIGEAPGAEEDIQGKPFVGRAGQLLTRMLQSVGWSRDEVYISNIVKCFISPRVLIYTAEGYKPIKDIRVGDLVLTHQGRFRKVVYVRPREVLPKGSPVIRISASPGEGNRRKPVHITVTPEHPFFIDGSWKPAGEIKPGDRIRTLGDRCEVCARAYFVRYDRYERRLYRTCSYRCHNLRIFHSPESRQKVRLAMNAQYASGRRDPAVITRRANERTRELVAAGQAKIRWTQIVDQPRMTEEILRRILQNHTGEYVFIDAMVVAVESRRTGRDVPLYNIGVDEDESYIAAGLVSHNCRPPGNRNPEPDEIASCEPFLLGQLAAIQPKVILALGSFAAQTLLKTKEPIGKLRGRVHPYGSVVLVPTFHPAFLLRNPGPEYRRMAWDDLKLARREYDRLRAGDSGRT